MLGIAGTASMFFDNSMSILSDEANCLSKADTEYSKRKGGYFSFNKEVYAGSLKIVEQKMDSHGRRVYGINERTYEKDLNTFFADSNRESYREGRRGGNKKTEAVTVSSSLGSVMRFLSTVIFLVTIFAIGKNIYDEMNRLSGSSNDQEGDVFDKMFGSEFSSKFKGARLNEGVYQKRREEKLQRDAKNDSNTTPPQEIRRLIPVPEKRLVQLLRNICLNKVFTDESDRHGYVREFSHCPQSPALFRVLYRGYTFRELLSPNIFPKSYLPEASDYILESFKVTV